MQALSIWQFCPTYTTTIRLFTLIFSFFSKIVVEFSNLNEMEEPEIGSKFLSIILKDISLQKLNSIELIV